MKSTDLGRMPDRELSAELRIFNNTTLGTPVGYALTAAQATELQEELDGYDADLDAYDAAQAAADAALEAKNLRRKRILQLARQQIKLARAAEGMDNKKLAEANLDVYDAEPTQSPAPSSVPTGYIDYGKHKHTIHFRDAATPDSEAKPDGMKGCDIWRFIGEEAPPVSEKTFDYVSNDTGTPYVAIYDGADAGKTVHYAMRWVSKSDEKGEWSQILKATING